MLSFLLIGTRRCCATDALFAQTKNPRNQQDPETTHVKLNLATLAVLLVFAVLFILQASRMPWTPARIIGLSIAASAFLLLIVARLQLGGAFSVQAKATTLVTTGLYARIRNPIY